MWTLISAVLDCYEILPEKSDTPGGLSICSQQSEASVSRHIPPGRGMERQPTALSEGVDGSFVLFIYYSVYSSSTLLLERRTQGELEMFPVRKDRYINSSRSRAQWQATINTRDPTQGFPFPESLLFTTTCARMSTPLGCATQKM